MQTISLLPSDYPAGILLSQAIWLDKRIQPRLLCGGLGHCGRCKARFVQNAPVPVQAEIQLFTEQEITDGWRLTCLHNLSAETEQPLELELPADAFVNYTQKTQHKNLSVQTGKNAVYLAVDLGTTSVCWQAVCSTGHNKGQVVEAGHFVNPQAGAGSDVMSRLAYAQTSEGRQILAERVREALTFVMLSLQEHGFYVEKICLAANTAMTEIFLQKNLEGLCVAPYRNSYSGHEQLQIHGWPPLYIPPLPGSFVGGDVSAGLAVMLAEKKPRPLILADLGTNGELALLTEQEQVFLVSVPLGPALEGIGPACGRPAAENVVAHFSLSPQGLWAQSPNGKQDKADGISASGYISLLAILFRIGLLASQGCLRTKEPLMPLTRKIADNLRENALRLDLPRGLWLEAGDLEEILKIRAAFVVALQTLLQSSGLHSGDIATLCLAGALGEHCRAEEMAELGFIPGNLVGRTLSVGNTSLQGATRLLLYPEEADKVAQLCRQATVLNLTEMPNFQNDFIQAMRFGAFNEDN